jgi:hypothetical protein
MAKSPKASAGELPPCLRVEIGKPNRKLGVKDGCTVVGATGTGVGKFAARPDYNFTSGNTRGGRGEKCGTTKIKSGKNKGKERPRVCSKPCGLIKPPVDKNGKPLVQRCPVQLAYDNSQPFLRLCSVKGQQGYRVNVTSPEDAMTQATQLCKAWAASGKKFDFPKTHPLGQNRRRKSW